MLMESNSSTPAVGVAYFAASEYEARLSAVRRAMSARDTQTILVSAPENIFYLTGLDHWGYFVPHVLKAGKNDAVSQPSSGTTSIST